MIDTSSKHYTCYKDNDIENLFLIAIDAAEHFIDSVQNAKSQDSTVTATAAAKRKEELLK
jgi:hypothetical protein